MTKNVTGKTGVLGIIGSPVSHSLSPVMQNAALDTLGLDFTYVPFPVAPADLAIAVSGLKSLGVAGFNVTIPHKEAIIPLLDRISPEAARAGAVNTVNREGDLFVGYNTDGSGFIRSLKDDLGFDPKGSVVLLLGAGGAARGALSALCSAGVSKVIVANRDMGRAQALINCFQSCFSGMEIALSSLDPSSLVRCLRDADLLVNTTSVGMEGTSFPGIDLSFMPENASVYDMVYAPPVTPLLAAAHVRGLRCANGLGMLAAQGEDAFEIWTGKRPPSGVMKDRLLTVLS